MPSLILNNWHLNNIFVLVDIAGTSVEQSEARYKDLIERSKHDRYQDIFDAEFITADCSRVRTWRWGGVQQESNQF